MTISRSPSLAGRVVEPGAQPPGDVVIPFAAGRAAGEQAGLPVDEAAMRRVDLVVEAAVPFAHRHFGQARIGPRLVPVEPQMLGGDRQRLQRPAGRRGPERQRRRRAQSGQQRLADLLRMTEAGAGQRRMLGLALHPPGGVEHGLAVAGDEEAASSRRQAGQSGGVDRASPRRAAIVVAEAGAVGRARLDDHVDAGAHRRASARRRRGRPAPRRRGRAPTSWKLGPSIRSQHRRAVALRPAEADMDLPAAARAPANGRSRGRAASPPAAVRRPARRSHSSGPDRGTPPSRRTRPATGAARAPARPSASRTSRRRRRPARAIAATIAARRALCVHALFRHYATGEVRAGPL